MVSRRNDWIRLYRGPWLAALAIAVIGLIASVDAFAHFRLLSPPQWIVDNAAGDPQKAAPCGVDTTIKGTPTNVVTTFAPGQTITLQWEETVAHDGWYRIALSYNNRADLVDPPYAANAQGNSTDAGIENPPVPPVLADGLFPHTLIGTAVPKMYTYNLTLPTTPCAKCTLQIIQVMLNHPYNHPGGYFYHHCADISIQAGDGGASGGSSGSSGSNGADASSGSSGADASIGSSGADASSGSSGSGGSSGSTGSGGSSGSSGSSGGSTGPGASSGVLASSGSSGAGGSSGSQAPATGAGAPGSGNSGCGCSVLGRGVQAGAGMTSLLAIAALLRRRRRA